MLLNTGRTKALYEGLSRLLDADDVPRTHRSWTENRRAYEGELTALQWWFVCFTLLRNQIAHGKPVPTESHLHEDHRHTDLGMHRLLQAVRATVIKGGYPWLEMAPEERRR